MFTLKKKNTIQTGNRCEELVAEDLKKKGFTIVARNFRCREGEIDIIATDGTTLVAYEVKSFPANWPPEDIEYKVSLSKQHKIRTTLAFFLETQPQIKYDYVRFDVVTVFDTNITYYEGAF